MSFHPISRTPDSDSGDTSENSRTQKQDATRLPSGLIELVREANLEEQALETGITVEMSTLDRPAPEWKEFWSTATIFPDVPWRSPRTLYTSSSGSSVEVIQILSCSSLPKRMPGRIFIRAAPLQESVVFWAMENEVFNSQQGRQMKLDHWITILESDSISESFVPQKEQIPLPGPSNNPLNSSIGGVRIVQMSLNTLVIGDRIVRLNPFKEAKRRLQWFDSTSEKRSTTKTRLQRTSWDAEERIFQMVKSHSLAHSTLENIRIPDPSTKRGRRRWTLFW